MVQKVFECEYRPGEELVLKFHPLPNLLPEEVRGHMRAARKEVLLALRGLLDVAIEGIEKGEKAGGKTRTRVQVQ